MRTFSQLSEFASVAQEYQRLRTKHPLIPARYVLKWINCDDASIGCSTIEQFVCPHEWTVNEESDAGYCCLCGLPEC
ncbi:MULTISPECIES: hypothetical protein [Caballeronia]|uniref:Uncharacterized protein n=1 Tax=Caballeronia zhejiangensis TaxID=871203 RepID=A0A656QFL2_9BURK|nr:MULTISPECIES: hypothetical protein [Caballeronia]KDR28518.1 hypothetical protein BG60_11095 [Caballeronia zhejiangensis]MCE4547843.1 hypothetical protein [Caballeronia sp. PC1]MCE4575603.1 hypothetical protein [Caballeronia sp. CLC5]